MSKFTDYTEKCRRISNFFYNTGLEKARRRDLTGACQCLKRSLQFDKYNTDARNLLGLIYYEIGETAEALVQWVISSNLQQDHNRATYYLHEVQGKPGRLEDESVHIRRYNQALMQAQNDNPDLAILQLQRVVDHKPNYIKAHMLLALLYLEKADYAKAGKSLYQVLQIDKNHPKASWYMSVVKKNTGRADIERRRLKNAFSHHQMEDDDIILPPSYKENTGWQMVLHIIAGLAIGAAAIFFLVMPSREAQLHEEHNQELNRVLEQVNQKSMEIDRIEAQAAAAAGERDDAADRLQGMIRENEGILAQYQTLVRILQAYKNEDFPAAVDWYTGLDASLIEDEAMSGVIAGIQADMEERGWQVLADAGKQAEAAGDHTLALTHFQNSLKIRGDNPQVMLDMALVYKAMEDEEKANEIFGQIILNYPDTEQAAQARTERGY